MEIGKGNRIRQNTQDLIKSQGLSDDELHALQEKKLRKLLLECIENVPAYKPYSHLKEKIESDSLEALKEFPVLDKETFRKNSDSYLNETVSKDGLISNRTGGSTSEPVRFYMDRHTVEYYEAARWRGLSWWGITPGSRSVMIWGNPMELNQAEEKKYSMKERWLKNRIIISAYSLKPEQMKNYIAEITKFHPEYIYGYASALYTFSTLMLEQNLEIPFKLKAVVSTAETLHDFQREAIQRAFKCHVVNEYGARDGGIIAYECPKGNMHISAENIVLEVVEDKTYEPLPKGESGILLTTDLNNFSMPRLRYKIGDRIALSKVSCDCGMPLPILDKIDGREDDMFVTVDGEFIHGHAFNHISRDLNSIKKFQIVQHRPDYAELKIIKDEKGTEEEIQQFIDGARNLLPKTEIDIKFVDDIPVTGSGKFRYAIRKF